jgi:septal ring factor EnvC (AmiA/AmiB activator)
VFVALCVITNAASAQQSPATADQARVEERIRALQRESEQLARSTRTLVGELRKLEIERDLRAAEAVQAEAAVADARRLLQQTDVRLAALEQERVGQLPGLRAQLVDLYKRGEMGYAQMLFAAEDVRAFGRASRAVAAVVELNRRRIEAHRKTLAAVRQERATAAERTKVLAEREAAARQARTAAERSVTARTRRIREIDSQRDTAAQYVGELQLARQALIERLAKRSDETSPAPVPLVPFRGALDWPIDGEVEGRFGQSANRLGGSAVRNGVEISAALGGSVRAVHGGTVAHADPFTGLGNLVILDHGGNHFSLYGYLGAMSVSVGQAVQAGQPLGQVGPSPAGPPALYFEMRIDGRAVDPVQWLEPR